MTIFAIRAECEPELIATDGVDEIQSLDIESLQYACDRGRFRGLPMVRRCFVDGVAVGLLFSDESPRGLDHWYNWASTQRIPWFTRATFEDRDGTHVAVVH